MTPPDSFTKAVEAAANKEQWNKHAFRRGAQFGHSYRDGEVAAKLKAMSAVQELSDALIAKWSRDYATLQSQFNELLKHADNLAKSASCYGVVTNCNCYACQYEEYRASIKEPSRD
jgi:hypothetical protein